MRRAAILVSIFLLAFSVLMFGRDDKLVNRGLDPGARGNIHTDTDDNGNTKLKVQVEHIATPQQLNPPRQFYVVWVQQQGESPRPIGELRVDRDHANGEVQSVIPAKVFDVFITAEDQPTPQSPSGAEVLRGHVDRS